MVGFVYVPVRRCKGISNRSVLLTYQLRRRDDVSAWSGTFKLIFKMCQFHLSTGQYILVASHVVQSHLGNNKCIAKTSQRRQSDLGTSWYFVTTSQIGWFYLRINEALQRRIKWIRLIDVPVATSWWHLSMVCDIPTYMRPKWNVATTSHAGWVYNITKNLLMLLNNCHYILLSYTLALLPYCL